MQRSSPFPPYRQLRPTALIYWIALKGGVDAFSRNLKTLDYSASKASPVVSVVKRMLLAKLNNSGLVHRVELSLNQGDVPNFNNDEQTTCTGYVQLRQPVSQREILVHMSGNLLKDTYLSQYVLHKNAPMRRKVSLQIAVQSTKYSL